MTTATATVPHYFYVAKFAKGKLNGYGPTPRADIAFMVYFIAVDSTYYDHYTIHRTEKQAQDQATKLMATGRFRKFEIAPAMRHPEYIQMVAKGKGPKLIADAEHKRLIQHAF